MRSHILHCFMLLLILLKNRKLQVFLVISVLSKSVIRKGKVIVVGSVTAILGFPRIAIYTATKHALFGYFNSLRYDYERSGSNITFTTCVIGVVSTDTAMKALKDEVPKEAWSSPADCAEAIVKGGELRVREVYFPLVSSYLLSLLRIFPTLIDLSIH